jgi:hypothetical protein
MGYAKLNFAVGQTNAQALYDIVRVVTGEVTAVANLSYASTTASEIVNTLGENWTVEYGTVAATTTSYVLTSPCVTAGKTHRVWAVAASTSAWPGSATYTSAGIYAIISLVSINDATSATSVSNPTYYSTSAAAGRNYMGVEVNTNNTNIYVSWSRYHVLIYGLVNYSNSNTGFIGSFEYPETSLTQFTNTAPVVQYNYNHSSSSTFVASTAPTTGTSITACIFQGLNVHEPVTSTTSGVYNFGNTGFGTVQMSVFDPNVSVDTGGVNSYPFVPIYWSLPSKGIPMINVSYYSNFYRVNKNIANPETVITVGSDNYVYLTLTAGGIVGTNGTAGIVVRKS